MIAETKSKPEKTESVRISRATMKEYRKWAKQTGRKLSFLVDRALRHHLLDKDKVEGQAA